MGGGGGQPSNTTTTTKTELPAWATQGYQNELALVNQINAKPYQQYPGQMVAGSNGQLDTAGNLASLGAQYALPGQQSQLNALNGVVNGKYNVNPQANPYQGATTQVGTNAYAGQNPFLQQMVNSSNADIMRSYNNNVAPQLAAQFSQGGAFGGSAYNQAINDSQNTLAQNLANSTNSLRFQDYTSQQGLAEDALNRSVQAQQTDLARNSALAQQGFQNQLSASGQNAQNILGASQGLSGINALQAQYNGQLANLGLNNQSLQQQNLNNDYNNWYQQNYGYDISKLNNYGNALNSISGNFQGQSTTGPNPNYQPKTAGGALASAGAGAAAGSMFGPWGTAIGGVVGGLSYYL